jgi:hypothetical protein
VAIDDLQAAVWQFADDQGIDVPDLGQDSPEGVLLLLGMRAPVLGVRTEVAGADAAKLFYPIADIHVGSGSPEWGFTLANKMLSQSGENIGLPDEPTGC